ncbi:MULTISPECIES: hypothetical protein [Anaerolinea]|uniref:hypothetical protein n=1 Tax=Anaerolinea TaxID=233189 RepID=UPI00261910BC|nr:hypothetical protein [Anaerolinea thermophila]
MSHIQQIHVNGISIGIEEAEELRFPSAADCNSPCWWKDNRLHVLTSTGHPVLSAGRDLYHLERIGEITYTAFRDGGRWIESVFPDGDGTLYGWYHNEPAHLIGEEYQKGRQFPLTAPMIGAVVSHDNGKTWDDLGIVLNGGPETLNLENHNYWFAGGNGDFSVILDRQQGYFYFLFGTYYRDVTQQGISIARMRFEDRTCPVGRVYKWYEGDWSQPGLLGKVTPVIPVHADWYSANPDTFWGPSVHWNRVLQQYVILMNRAIDPRWAQDGIYISFTPDLSQPHRWTPPVKILDEKGWYPQVIGLENGDTDREAGASARLFIHGISRYILHFG